MKKNGLKSILVFAVISFTATIVAGQTKMPDELNTSQIEDQFKYVDDHTRIYEGFRAIREDIFQKINGNFLDTLAAERSRITELKNIASGLTQKTDSLNALLETTRKSLEDATATKNSIRVLGLELNKRTYNAIMWILVGALAFLMGLGFLIFKRNLVVLLRTEKDLKELKDEFAAYKQTSRLAREKLEMENFRLGQKLKAK